jgi:LacI family transcriptional regulator
MYRHFPSMINNAIFGLSRASQVRILPGHSSRLKGYREAHEAAGLPVDRTLIRHGDWWQKSGAQGASELLAVPTPPTALFCANDWMAMGE